VEVVLDRLGCVVGASAARGTALQLGLEGLHSARRGDYRGIYRIGESHRRVEILAIEHRSDVYRKRDR
jgi:mRNA-degrading endonuclease RelE of RelBE toxin-antitoxin system